MTWELLALIEEPALPMDAADCFTIAYKWRNDELSLLRVSK